MPSCHQQSSYVQVVTFVDLNDEAIVALQAALRVQVQQAPRRLTFLGRPDSCSSAMQDVQQRIEVCSADHLFPPCSVTPDLLHFTSVSAGRDLYHASSPATSATLHSYPWQAPLHARTLISIRECVQAAILGVQTVSYTCPLPAGDRQSQPEMDYQSRAKGACIGNLQAALTALYPGWLFCCRVRWNNACLSWQILHL